MSSIMELKDRIAELEDERDAAFHEAGKWEKLYFMRKANTAKLVALLSDIQALKIADVQFLFERHNIELPEGPYDA